MTWYLRPMTQLPLFGVSLACLPPPPEAPQGSGRRRLRAGQDLPVGQALVGVGLPGQAEGALADHVLVDLVAAAGDRHAADEVELLDVPATVDPVGAPEEPVR